MYFLNQIGNQYIILSKDIVGVLLVLLAQRHWRFAAVLACGRAIKAESSPTV